MKLSVRIRTARVRAGLTQTDLAKRLGISRTAVVNWESEANRARPSGERLEEISHLTNVAWEWLATGRGQARLSSDGINALDAELIDDPIERRLLKAFRERNAHIKQAVLVLLEASSPVGR
ncbi:helix-turn-helix transcriptional regulator [Stenotrophomonas sp. SY1]|uniref:helix-turn-helix transcriptional regulator n=1 Tax=Stenotrophomonas sp. SY1 TaxID=477235 RepID=UPI001E48F763|nr:helix-turn-helix transcriptional regulator [Stenotrophomonas sp. SY1]MCD9086226.1 helix-turn-helix domain-containing protein [Stenotrophomonas sp. SY1]